MQACVGGERTRRVEGNAWEAAHDEELRLDEPERERAQQEHENDRTPQVGLERQEELKVLLEEGSLLPCGDRVAHEHRRELIEVERVDEAAIAPAAVRVRATRRA